MNAEQAVSPSPFHAGEQAMQRRQGLRETMEGWGRQVIRPFMPPVHRAFYAGLPYMVIAARDAQGRAWATLLCGEPGFASSPDPRTLQIDARPVTGDALEEAFVPGADVGVLGIELHTRRRNRVNGRVLDPTGAGEALALSVDQSFGNCPQHIHVRAWTHAPQRSEPTPARRSATLDAAQRERIRGADTLFIASGYRGEGEDPAFGMDASHRGGPAGFVRVGEDGRSVVIPDYAGNNYFNTVGNLLVDPRVGLLFVDFASGGLLQLTGRARIDTDPSAVASFAGARRLIRVEVEAVVELPEALPLRWGTEAEGVRELQLVSKRRESAQVCSLYFAARGGGKLPRFDAGQHLPVELRVPGQGLQQRSYSLSNAPNDEFYRISVKREPKGLVSGLLHELELGAVIGARPPSGDFVLTHTDRPVVLVSAGVGVTPLLSMLYTLALEDEARPVCFIHGARDGAHHPFREELQLLARARPEISMHVAYSRPRADDLRGRDYDSAGRLDAARVLALAPSPDADFYLCGPVPFMTALRSGLVAQGVMPVRIHSESFGPSAS